MEQEETSGSNGEAIKIYFSNRNYTNVLQPNWAGLPSWYIYTYAHAYCMALFDQYWFFARQPNMLGIKL